jgi:hypothetical protein
MFNEKPSKTNENFEKLNNVLKYDVEGFDVTKFISKKGLDSLTNKYIADKTYEKSAGELVLGDWAVLVENDKFWQKKEYIADRNKLITPGTRGEVVMVKSSETSPTEVIRLGKPYESGYSKIFLQFPQLEKMVWTKKGKIMDDFINQSSFDLVSNNTAVFLPTEVKGVPQMSTSQVELMKKNLNTTKDLIENYNKIDIVKQDKDLQSSDKSLSGSMIGTTIATIFPEGITIDTTTIKDSTINTPKIETKKKKK